MSNLSSIWIKTETLQTLLNVATKKQVDGIEITVSTNDTANDYGQNVTAFVAQTKEQRDAKKPRFYVGNGKVFWTDGKISVIEKTQQTTPEPPSYNSDGDDGLPF